MSSDRRATPPLLLILGVVLVALNLRPVLAGFGPLLPQVQQELGLSAAVAGLLTTIPLLCWGLLAFLAPVFTRRWSSEAVILALMLVLSAGAALRAGPSLPWVLLGTVLVGASIAVVNVLLPSLVRRDFPERVGLMLGVYTLGVVSGAALASALAVPLRDTWGGSWRASLTTWAVWGLVGALGWLPAARGRQHRESQAATDAQSLRHNPYALPVTLFMGLQSLVFFTWLTWLPKYLQDQGLSAATSGWLLSMGNLIQLPFALLFPILAARLRHPLGLFGLVALSVALMLGGLLGLWRAPGVPLPWVLLSGAGFGSVFPLALYFITTRAATPAQVPQLSALAQGVGYLIAATGPFLFGALHDLTRGWNAPFWFLTVLVGGVLLTGWFAARPRQLHGPQSE